MLESAPVLAYVAGAGRSGSTLLDALLGNHSRVSATGELQRLSLNPDTRRCSCGRTIAACPRWSAIEKHIGRGGGTPTSGLSESPVGVVRQRLQGRLPQVSEMTLILGSARLQRILTRASVQLRSLVGAAESTWDLVDVIASKDGSDIVVDTSKNAVRLKALYLANPHRTRVVHLVRDGRAVAASHMRRKGASIADAAHDWVRRNRNVELMLSSVPRRRWMRLRYEDLCTNPERHIEKLCAFLGLEFEPGMSRLDTAQMHAIPGNTAFYRRRDTRISLDQRWVDELNALDLKMFEPIAGRRNRRYGYD